MWLQSSQFIQSSRVSLWMVLTSPLLQVLLTLPSQIHIQMGQLGWWDALERPMGFAISWWAHRKHLLVLHSTSSLAFLLCPQLPTAPGVLLPWLCTLGLKVCCFRNQFLRVTGVRFCICHYMSVLSSNVVLRVIALCCQTLLSRSLLALITQRKFLLCVSSL